MCHVLSGRAGDDPDIEVIYQNVNNQVETLTKRLDVIMKRIMVPLFILFPVSVSIWKYNSSDYSNEAFIQIYPAT